MNKVVQELKMAVDKTSDNAQKIMSGEKTAVSGLAGIVDGVLEQNIVLSDYWRILLRDVQRLTMAMADRQRDVSAEVKRAKVDIMP